MTYIKNNGKMRESESTDYKYDKNGNMIFTITNKSSTNTNGKARLEISVLEDLKDYKYEERTYDGLNRMTKVRNTNGITEYKYRPDGLRLTKQTGEKEILYAWNGNQIIAEIEDSSREKKNVYSYGRERIRKGVYFDDVEYYIYNAHGNVVQLAGETQYKHYDDEFEWIDKNLKKTYEYDAFGNELNSDENDTNYFRYCGEYYDKETENIYLRTRYYDILSGRFTSEDKHWNVENMIYGDEQVSDMVISVSDINFITDFDKINKEKTIFVNKNDIHNLGLNLRKKDDLDEFRESYYVIKKCDNLSVIQSSNLYVYAVNNPLNFKDSYGEAVYGAGIETGGGLGFYVSGQAYFVIDDKGNKGFLLLAI